jgi:uncharacterized protein (DUF488 family)
MDRRNITHQPVYTIGYGSRSVAEFVTLLQRYSVAYLLDVRSKPYSKFNPDFTRSQLEAHLTTAGFQYVYMGDTLGGQPDTPSCYTKDGKVNYARVREKEFFQRGIRRLQDAVQKNLCVVLMCSEAKPEMCHRSKLIGEVLTEQGIEVIHIDETGQPVTQQAALLRLSGGQLGFPGFIDPGYTSRKSYLEPGEEDEHASD